MQPAAVLVFVVVPLLLPIIGIICGRIAEHRHFKSLDLRERQLSWMMVTDLKTYAPNAEASKPPKMIVGEVCIATDYLKSFFASLRKIVGGEIKSYNTLTERARREAVLRVKEEAERLGYNAVCNLRLNTADIGGATSARKAAMVEMIAIGTAYRRSEE